MAHFTKVERFALRQGVSLCDQPVLAAGYAGLIMPYEEYDVKELREVRIRRIANARAAVGSHEGREARQAAGERATEAQPGLRRRPRRRTDQRRHGRGGPGRGTRPGIQRRPGRAAGDGHGTPRGRHHGRDHQARERIEGTRPRPTYLGPYTDGPL